MKLNFGKLNFGSLAKRIGAGVLTAAATAAVQITATGQVPHTATEIGLTVLTGLIAAVPSGAAPAGILTPAAPGQAAALPALLSGLKALLATPSAKREARIIAIASAAGRGAAQGALAELTGQFGPGQLAQAAPVSPPPVGPAPLPPAAVPDLPPAMVIVAPPPVEAAPVGQ